MRIDSSEAAHLQTCAYPPTRREMWALVPITLSEIMNTSRREEEQIDPYRILDAQRFMDYEQSAVASPLLPAILECIAEPNLNICDVGGASGLFLKTLSERSSFAFNGTVLEVNEEYRTHLVDPSLAFINASILSSGLPNDHYDVVTFRHILHHLVTDSIAGTLALQSKALSEMMRIVKPGGVLAFQEQIHYVRPFSRAVYHLSKAANRFGLHWRYFEAGTVVISFLTPDELDEMVTDCAAGRGMKCLRQEDTPRSVDLRWRLTFLMSSVGDAFYVLRKARA